MVDFPDPDGPTNPMVDPALMVAEKFFKTGTSLLLG